MIEEIEVIARFNQKGKIIPLSFRWKGQNYSIESAGRRWEDDHGIHMLVMVTGNHSFEILYSPGENRWYLIRIVDNIRFIV